MERREEKGGEEGKGDERRGEERRGVGRREWRGERRRAVPFTVGEGRQQESRAEGSREEARGGEWQLFKLLGADTEK